MFFGVLDSFSNILYSSIAQCSAIASEQTTHLGLIRAVKNEEKVNIENKITLARKTLYSLLNTGVHSTNGINPKVSYKIYQAYILPRLLSGLETLQLNQTQINELSLFHR